MKSVTDTCQPRPEILTGGFNPDVFTVSLSPIIDYYRKGKGAIDGIYTDARLFFKEATYPTQGIRLTLAEVFGRLAGDMNVPSIHRLETAFGGGKTHSLIACTHIAYRGSELSEVTGEVIDPALLPEPGTVSVVGVAGDLIPVHKPLGDALAPHTLWGEIAYQIGGEGLYKQVEHEAQSHAAPGGTYFERVFGNRKVLVMLDELAQYAARLEAATPDGADQLAAFLMALHGYARTHPGIAIILTLASAADAFAKQTERLAGLVGDVRGEEIGEDDALAIGERAVKGVASVVARDAVQVTPVLAGEVTSVLAKRLFVSIDRTAAEAVSEQYHDLYERNASVLPDGAASQIFKGRMIANYPFHPTLVDYLNNKLAAAENFQGTRGVLRVLALVVQNIWHKKVAAPMIHVCHLDLRSAKVVNEILGRTASSDLRFIVNADIGGVDTGSLEEGVSNAGIADGENPHPEGHPLHEYTWKTVFLHSLVGREEGLSSNVFGLTESEALFDVAFPSLTPPQVQIALDRIVDSAFYLRFEQGKYYAGAEPTINSVLARIRRTLTAQQVEALLNDTARKIIGARSELFLIEHDVSLPDHVPDGKSKPTLAVVSLNAAEVDVGAIIKTKGENKPRAQQNLVFLLVPETVRVSGDAKQEGFLYEDPTVLKARRSLEDTARQVRAMRILVEKPDSYGVNPRRLEDDDFKKRKREREQALQTLVSGIYSGLHYPSATGSMVRKEIRTAGGEGGVPFINAIRETLLQDGELLTEHSTTRSDLTNLSKLFFEKADTVALDQLRTNFHCIRSWPVLEDSRVLEQMIRAGVEMGIWHVFRMGEADSLMPAELYTPDAPVPLGADLSAAGYNLVTPQGAKQRHWVKGAAVDLTKVREGILYTVGKTGKCSVKGVSAEVGEHYGEVSPQSINEAVTALVRNKRLYVFQGEPAPGEKAKPIIGPSASLYNPQPGDLLVTPARAVELGWVSAEDNYLRLDGRDGADKVLPLLRRLGSFYDKGAKSTIRYLDLVDLKLRGGGTIRVELSEAAPQTMRTLGELFEVLDNVVEAAEEAEVVLEIVNPDESCPLVQKLKKNDEGSN